VCHADHAQRHVQTRLPPSLLNIQHLYLLLVGYLDGQIEYIRKAEQIQGYLWVWMPFIGLPGASNNHKGLSLCVPQRTNEWHLVGIQALICSCCSR